jgi:hypothetical protein
MTMLNLVSTETTVASVYICKFCKHSPGKFFNISSYSGKLEFRDDEIIYTEFDCVNFWFVTLIVFRFKIKINQV